MGEERFVQKDVEDVPRSTLMDATPYPPQPDPQPQAPPLASQPDVVNQASPQPDVNAALTQMQAQMNQIVGVVTQQQEVFKDLQAKGLRQSDVAAIRREGLEMHAIMTERGWHVELAPGFTQGHFNQLKAPVRAEIQQMATRMRHDQHQEALAYRKTGKSANVNFGEEA